MVSALAQFSLSADSLFCSFHLAGGVFLIELGDVLVVNGVWVVLGIEKQLAARLAALQQQPFLLEPALQPLPPPFQ